MKPLLSFLIAIAASSLLYSQSVLKGTITTKDSKQLVGAIITVKDNKTGKRLQQAVTDDVGKFQIKASKGDLLIVTADGFELFQIELTGDMISNGIDIGLSEKVEVAKAVKMNGGAQSPKSYWIGAKVGYNFDGFSDDDLDNYFVGAAKVILNESEKKFLRGTYGVIGNIAGFISKQNREEASKDKEKLALSVQGLAVGLYQLWEQEVSDKSVIREFFTGNYRLNTFRQVGIDSVTVNLSQVKLTGGFEFETVGFTKSGALNFAIELTHLRFDQNRYQLVFGEKKKSLTSLEVGAILPVSSNLGFFASGTFAPSLKPIYLFGIIVRSDAR